MHPLLSALESELRGIAVAIKQLSSDDRPANVITPNAFIAGTSRNDLALIASNIADNISVNGGDEISLSESQLTYYTQALQFLRSNTVPNLFNGNGTQAIPTYMLTLDAISRGIAPELTLEPSKIIQNVKEAKTLQIKLRGLIARVSDLEPKTDNLQKIVVQIVQAHEAADQLPTDLVSLRETRDEIEKINGRVKECELTAGGLLAKVQEYENKLLSNISNFEKELDKRQIEWSTQQEQAKEKAEAIISRCEDAMRSSTSRGLAGAFYDQADDLKKSIKWWVLGLLFALGSGVVFGGIQFRQLSEAIQNSTPSSIIWMKLIISLLSVGGPIWFGWLSSKQIGYRFRLAEDYAYKAAISKAYEGYRREAVELDSDFQIKLFTSALSRLDEQPLRFVNQKTHGSPWHEFFDSELIREAIRITPDLAGKFTDMAKNSLNTAKKNKESAQKTKRKAETEDNED